MSLCMYMRKWGLVGLCLAATILAIWLIWHNGSTCPVIVDEPFDAMEDGYDPKITDTIYHTSADDIANTEIYMRKLTDTDTGGVKYSSMIYSSIGYNKLSPGIPANATYIASAQPNYVPSYEDSVTMSRSGATTGTGGAEPVAANGMAM